MIQRDSLPENVVLQGHYEVRKNIYTTQVERDYEVYNREEKKEYWMKEFYPSNYCGRGADGQMVIVRGTRNRSVFEKSKEEFGQAYRQIAACSKTKGIPEVACLFQANNTVYVILEKRKGERLLEQVRRVGGKLVYAKSVPVMRAIVETLLQMHAPSGYFPKISKESILFLNKQNKTQIIFTEIVPKEDVIYSVGSLWYEILTGLCPETSSIRAPSELGVQLPDEAERMILRCLEKNTGNSVSLEDVFAIFPQKPWYQWKKGKKPILFAAAAVAVLAAVLSLFSKEGESGESSAESEPVYVETSGTEQIVTPSVVRIEEPQTVSEGGIQERAVSGQSFSVEPVNAREEKGKNGKSERAVSGQSFSVEPVNIREEKGKGGKQGKEKKEKIKAPPEKGKDQRKPKRRKKSEKKGKKNVYPPAAVKPQNRQGSDLFDLW